VVAGLPLSTWVAAALVFLAVSLGTVSIALLLEVWRERGRRRRSLEQLRQFGSEGIEQDAAQNLIRQLEEGGPLLSALARVPQIRDLGLTLRQAGSTINVQSFLLLSMGTGGGLGLAALTLTRSVLFSAFIAVVGALFPYWVMQKKRARRMGHFEEQLPETIDLLGRAIRAGHPLSAGLRMVADETPEPVQGEFRQAFEEQRFGLPLEDSLMGMADRVGLIDVRILTTAILIQRSVGGNLAEILDNLSYTIRERFKIRRQLRVYTAQGRMSGYVLALLPVGLGCVFYMLNPDYIMILFRDPAGKFGLVVAVILQLIGFLWIRKIVDIEI
jgi:tight adherence protein B